GSGRGAAAARPAGRGQRRSLPGGRRARGAPLQRPSVSVRPRRGRRGAGRARGRAARAGGAAAHRAVRPAALARGPAGVGGMAAGGFALLWTLRARLAGVRLGLALLALATLAGWLWP